MPNLLLIESSNEVCSVALSQEKSIIQEKYIDKVNSHSVYLAPFVDEVLNNAMMSINELDGVVISDGPGSYLSLIHI